ncbi:undecaprenyl-diphosphate phosphatase [Paenibacillus apiarius]|uniref:undecaprenyl-diphosphate phosphatase n=1 Tax=Paenibacillus apiarius TaxID=46240 RepID=UPI001980CF1D|nr:undecaprenyl-diphosphate phosphatase [Paenibacillus apiarius]MBN3522943.1 undecaprenyl-diphosphate phosphatase [Paenibacillus apiarius]
MIYVMIAIVLGIVEGLTEFIPVSSTGHMILTTRLMGITEQAGWLKTFEIVIQLGAILAITVVYWHRIMEMLGLRSQTVQQGNMPAKRLNLLHVALGIGPAVLVAFFAKDYVKSQFDNTATVLWALVVGGAFMWFAEWIGSKKKPSAESMEDISYKQALLIGLYQILSVVWPGFSRSGSTMSGGMLSGVSYRAAADFSFLIAIPIMVMASGYELLENYKMFTPDIIGFFALGFIVSFIVAYIVVVTFLNHIQRIRLRHFAIYRFVLAALFWFFILR